MSESPRDRMKRQPNRLRHPHAGQSLEPTLTRKGLLAHPGSLAIGFAAIAFFVYVFNLGGVQTGLDALLNGLNQEARSHNDEVASWFVKVLPYIGMAVVTVLVFLALTMLKGVIAGAAGSSKPKSKSKKSGRTTLDEFVKTAAGSGVGERLAREAYSLLAPRYGKAPISMSDSLGKKLSMTPAQIADMQGTLMRYTDRQIKVGGAGAAVHTVLDLLMTVETSTVRTAGQQNAPDRVSKDEPVRFTPVPAAEEKKAEAVVPEPVAATATFIRPYRPEKTSGEGAAKVLAMPAKGSAR